MEAKGIKFIKKVGVRDFNTQHVTDKLSDVREFYSLNVMRIEHIKPNNTGLSKGCIFHVAGSLYSGMIALVLNGADLFELYKIDENYEITGEAKNIYIMDLISDMNKFIKKEFVH